MDVGDHAVKHRGDRWRSPTERPRPATVGPRMAQSSGRGQSQQGERERLKGEVETQVISNSNGVAVKLMGTHSKPQWWKYP